MIRLHQFKRQWGIANPSPFCMKVETYLRMTGLAYEVIEEASPLNAPKKKAALHRRRGEGDPGLGFHHRLPQGELRKPPRRRSVARAASRSAPVAAFMRREPALARRVFALDRRLAGGASSNRPSLAPCLPCCGMPCPGSRNGASNACCGCKAWRRHRPAEIYAALASRISRRSPPA